MKIIRTASFDKLSKKKKLDTKPAKMPKNNRGQWDMEEDFDNRIRDQFSGEADEKKEDAMNDKWKQLFNNDKKREPAYAKSKKKKKKEPDAVLTSKMIEPFKR
jgi:hypothetical protein